MNIARIISYNILDILSTIIIDSCVIIICFSEVQSHALNTLPAEIIYWQNGSTFHIIQMTSNKVQYVVNKNGVHNNFTFNLTGQPYKQI